MISRRRIVLALGAGALAPFAVLAQQAAKVFRIGFLGATSASGSASRVEALRAGLRDLGYVEGKNIAFEFRWSEGNYDRLSELAAELVRLKVDVIVTSATPVVEAAKHATSTIPIVMATTADAVGTGLVDSLAHPGGNVTGQTMMSVELAGKRLQIVRESLPNANRIALLTLAGVGGTRMLLEQLRPIAQKMKIRLVVPTIAQAEDLPGAFAVMRRERAQALIVQSSPLSYEHRARIVELAAQHHLFAVYETRDFPDSGGLISYGPNNLEGFRRAAYFVDKILKGAKPGDLPIEQPTRFELIINMKTAKALGIAIPPTILQRADRVIE